MNFRSRRKRGKKKSHPLTHTFILFYYEEWEEVVLWGYPHVMDHLQLPRWRSIHVDLTSCAGAVTIWHRRPMLQPCMQDTPFFTKRGGERKNTLSLLGTRSICLEHGCSLLASISNRLPVGCASNRALCY